MNNNIILSIGLNHLYENVQNIKEKVQTDIESVCVNILKTSCNKNEIQKSVIYEENEYYFIQKTIEEKAQYVNTKGEIQNLLINKLSEDTTVVGYLIDHNNQLKCVLTNDNKFKSVEATTSEDGIITINGLNTTVVDTKIFKNDDCVHIFYTDDNTTLQNVNFNSLLQNGDTDTIHTIYHKLKQY